MATLKWRDTRFRGWRNVNGVSVRLAPDPDVKPDSYITPKKGRPIPVYKLHPVDASRYPGYTLRKIRADGKHV